MPQHKPRIRRALRILQLCSLLMLLCGALSLLPLWGNFDEKACGAFAMMAGGAGVVGLSFTLHRTLMAFTILSWVVAIFAVASIVVHVCNRELNPLQWT